MTFESGMSGLQLRSLVKSNGELELSLVAIPTPKPGADEVVVRVEAAPINPTDIFLLLGAADLATFEASEAGGRAVVKAKIPAPVMKGMTGCLDQS
ncbi:MAG: NADH oxidase, partial [Roseiarcus sp.]